MRNMLLFKKSLLIFCLLATSDISIAQVTEKWVKRENGDANSPDEANGLVIDKKNDVIVTGGSMGKGTGYDYATIKYDDSGHTKWVKRFNGPVNGDDQATAIAVDDNDNVYVTGWSTGQGTDKDYTTIKYDGNGDKKWIKRFNGPGNGADEAVAIAIDVHGNLYVTGWSTGIGTGVDYTTIKYDTDGNKKWVRTYNGPGNSSDQATAIALDKNGNLYITGSSTGNGTGRDYTTIKYDDAGNLQWVNRYNGPVNGDDIAKGLAIDGNGTVYVTGMITTSVAAFNNPTDIATIKYNTTGIQQWVKIEDRKVHDEANAIAVDAAGNVYLAATSKTFEENPVNDLVTIKYRTDGQKQWLSTVTGAGYYKDAEAHDLLLDPAGNVYVTGGVSMETSFNYVTVKYNPLGSQQWLAVYAGPGSSRGDIAKAIGMDAGGNVYITGSSAIENPADYATVRYNVDGKQQWVKRYNGPGDLTKGGNDVAMALAVDKHGSVYVTGGVTRNNTGLDYTTIKYDCSGSKVWEKTYNGPVTNADQATAIALDDKDNVYVTGKSRGCGTRDDFATIRYNEQGDIKWIKRYNGPGNGDDQAIAVAVDAAGNVYVTGSSEGKGTDEDYTTIKYDQDGNVKWIKRFNGPANGRDEPVRMAIDKAGNVYVTGWSTQIDGNTDFITIKYDTNGNELWVATYNSPENSYDYPYDLAVDASGNVYVTGNVIIKYNTGGVQQWVAHFESSPENYTIGTRIAVSNDGNVYVTGESGDDYITAKYNAAGVLQWTAFYGTPNDFDAASAMALDNNGNVYVTGESSDDYVTVKYNASGILQWEARYKGPGNFIDDPTAIGLDKNGNVYITGESIGIDSDFDYATIKYEQTPVLTMSSTQPNTPVILETLPAKLHVKAFPNAFTDLINLQWSGRDKPVSITITDATGRLVEKRSGLAASGTLQIGNNYPQGIFFAEIVQGTDKILLKLMKQ